MQLALLAFEHKESADPPYSLPGLGLPLITYGEDCAIIAHPQWLLESLVLSRSRS